MCFLLDRCAVKKDTFRPLCLVRKVKSLKRDFELPLFQIVFLRSIYFNYIYFNFTPFLLQYAHVYVVIRVYEKCGRLYQDKLKLQAHRLLFHLGILGLLNPMTSTLAIHVLKKVVCVLDGIQMVCPHSFKKICQMLNFGFKTEVCSSKENGTYKSPLHSADFIMKS